mgnify:FL=1
MESWFTEQLQIISFFSYYHYPEKKSDYTSRESLIPHQDNSKGGQGMRFPGLPYHFGHCSNRTLFT